MSSARHPISGSVALMENLDMSKYLSVIVCAVSLAWLPNSAAGGNDGLSAVFGLATAPNGDLLAADGAAGVVPIRRGRLGRAIPVPGATRDVSPIGRSSMWVVTGAASEDGGFDSGQALRRVSAGRSRTIANLFEFEARFNPAGGSIDSNPFDVEAIGGTGALVADAGGNDLLRVDNRGAIEVLAVFPDELVSTENIKSLVGCPTPPPPLAFVCGLPPVMPAQAVPTSIAIGPDGSIYVGELKGFPAPTGQSNIWRVAPNASWAQCGSSPACSKVFAGGFTSIIDMAFGPDGNLYVAELDEASWLALEGFGAPLGGSISACDVPAGTCQEVAAGIPILTAITFGKDGVLWATRNALIPGAAEVVAIP